MFVKLFLFLISLSAILKETLWKNWYQALAKYRGQDWRFMNYGYAPLKEKPTLYLSAEDEKNRLFIQLYCHVLEGFAISGKKVLEVGSGRGGGAEFIARNLSPASIIGVDFSKNAVDFCNQLYKRENLSFMEGNAEKLPFENGSFDVVYNVESSHCYGDMKSFVSEVYRVLKPGGVFAWADLRLKQDLEKDETIFKESSFNLISKENITPNVIQALDLISEQKEQAIQERVPKFIQKIFSEFAGVRNSKIFKGFKDGTMVYWVFRFKK